MNRQQWHKRLFQGFIENWNKGVNEIGAKAWGKAIFLHDPSVGVQSFLDPNWVIGIHEMGGLNQEIKDFLHDLWLPTLLRANENKDIIEQFPGERGDTFELDMISLVFSAAIIDHDIIMSNDDIGTLAELLVDYKNLDIPENKNNDDQFRVFETWFRRVILEREMNHDNISGAADKATTVVDKATTARGPKM